MALFLHSEELNKAVREIAQEDDAKLAVAFWGRGGLELVSQSAKIICNLKMGGSNPFELQNIEKKLSPGNIRQCDTLHAKIYLGRTKAVVTSANASANGLGLEAGEQAGWLEAGALVTDIGPIHDWFDALWEGADTKSISAEDWKATEAAWSARQRRKPTLRSFRDFDVTQARLPMPLPVANEDWDYNEKALSESGNAENKTLRNRIDLGVEVLYKSDTDIMENRWAFYWQSRNSQPYMPKKRQSFLWTFIGSEFLEDAFIWNGSDEYSDALLSAEEQPPCPFDANNNNFSKAFQNVISRHEFSIFRLNYNDEAWYANAEKILHDFWIAVKKEYEANL
ncbi:phospholipase D family protein [Xanthobacter sediminis]|uniref:phospholipase D family protein n=1 Tax=Xanthobacter sediminis TaxID=3119926 RepID=UPI00372B17C3